MEVNTKLKFNHPVREIYPFLSNDNIKKITNAIRENTIYKTGPIPINIFREFIAKFLGSV
jgi:hypothetical protein